MLELHFVEKEISNPTVQITWCLDRETLEKVKDLKNPGILVCVIPEVGEGEFSLEKESRSVFSLKDGLGYLPLYCRGKNRVVALLVDDVQKAKKCFVEFARFNSFGERIFFSGGELREDLKDADVFLYDSKVLDVSIPFDIDVPDGIFAPEPPQWEQDWVLWLVNERGKDQCDFRKRRLFAYSIQPILLLLKLVVIGVSTLVSAFLGMKGCTLKWLLHPLNHEVPDAFDPGGDELGLFEGGTIFIRPNPLKFKYRDPRTVSELFHWIFARCWAIPFWPPFLSVVWVFGIFGILKIVSLCCLGLFGWLPFIFVISSTKTGERIFNFFARLTETEKKIEEDDITQLICTGEVKVPKKKTVKLRFDGVKRKICKPFSR